MVLLERIELSTSPLPRECSTSELQQHRARLIRPKSCGVQGLSGRFFIAALEKGMADKSRTPKKENRQDRLKAALKANLARRKAQTRARAADDGKSTGKTEG